jgi:hypothetical protein
MSAIREFSDGQFFPGAQSLIPADLAIGDCTQYPTFQDLVAELQFLHAEATSPTTIRGGVAYSESDVAALTQVCQLP